ncbi:alpha/beta hydrolase [Umezawaea endophytica]|uniref:Alpha/beta hydrolase-fold protein n=1 Tax=Umezawaea endophytica TaxID=1654476 RepID=A0A9X3AGX5_9PSEU|nr:alpha/beta hydrolase-fold protein [Umezawaea endophytica]MCS7480692.1 alpha/beta hydrolase-fold protein [Umezawaea endophytica]
MTSPLELSLITGPVPVVVAVCGAAAGVALLAARGRTWWTRVVPISAAACALLAVGVALIVDRVWKPFPEPLPAVVPVCLGVVVLGVVLAVARWRHDRWPRRALSAVAALVVLVSGLSGVNQHFGQYSTLRTALGSSTTVPLDVAAPPATGLLTVPPGKGLADVWSPPADLPVRGTVSETPIPSSTDYRPRPAMVYLPPAYAAANRPRLPVLVLLSGQPGTPHDWFDAGELARHLDAYARLHRGLAPIVVVPDQLGSTTANPMCLDSPLGKVETYLAKDVPGWIRNRLQVNGSRGAWTIAGLSQGGTCSFQLAVRAPEVYARFIDLSGQREPTLGTRADTVRAAFGGDEAAFRRVNPLDVLARTRFPDTQGMVVAGRDDATYRDDDREVYEACLRAGMDVRWRELPGAHDWRVWRSGLVDALPWLGERTGLGG